MNGPAGKGFGVIFVWASSNLHVGQTWLSRVSSWSPVSMSTVSPTTMAAFNETTKAIAPQAAYGKSLTMSFKDLTPEVINVLCKHAVLQPNSPATILGMHELRECAPKPSMDTLIADRTPHFMMELLPTVRDPDLLDAALVWAEDLYEDLMSTSSDNKLISTYLPLTGPDKVNMRGIYGEKYEVLKLIKHKYDPDNVFEHALAQV